MHLYSVYLMCLASAFTVAHGEKANIWTQKMTALLPRYGRDNYQSLLLLPRGPPSGRSKPLPARSHSSGSISSKSYSPSNGLTTSSSSEGRWDPDQHDPNGDSVSAKVKAHGPAKIRTRIAAFKHKTSAVVDSDQTRKRKVRDANQAEAAVHALRGGHGEVAGTGAFHKIDVDARKSKLGGWLRVKPHGHKAEVRHVSPGDYSREELVDGKSQAVVEGGGKAKITTINAEPNDS